MWNLKYKMKALFTKQKWIHRHREHTCGPQGAGGWSRNFIGSLGFAGVNYYIQDGYTRKSYYTP